MSLNHNGNSNELLVQLPTVILYLRWKRLNQQTKKADRVFHSFHSFTAHLSQVAGKESCQPPQVFQTKATNASGLCYQSHHPCSGK